MPPLENASIHLLFGLDKGQHHRTIITLDRFFNGAVAFVLADVGPGVLNIGHRALVYRCGIRLR